MHPLVRSSLALALLLSCAASRAQSTLGELLDAGAKQITAAEFRQEVVQRTVFGPSPAGGTLEIVYRSSGLLTGVGTPLFYQGTVPRQTDLDGEWTADDKNRICTIMRFTGARGGSLPPRCQYWFRLGDEYYLSDSDTDRYAKVLRRSVKK